MGGESVRKEEQEFISQKKVMTQRTLPVSLGEICRMCILKWHVS